MLSILLSILLFILKLIGILLLIILLLILLLLLVPIRYRFEGSSTSQERIYGKVNVSWFLILIRCQAGYIESSLRYTVKILGYSLITNDPDILELKEKKKEKKKKKEEKKKESSDEDVSTYYNIEDYNIEDKEAGPDESEAVEERTESPELKEDELALAATVESSSDTTASVEEDVLESSTGDKATSSEKNSSSEKKSSSEKSSPSKKKSSSEKSSPSKKKSSSGKSSSSGTESSDSDSEQKSPGRIERLRSRLGQLQNFLTEYQIFYLLDLGKKTIFRILRHVLPYRLNGWLRFGLDDPSLTGKITAMAAMFYPVYGRSFSLEPDFQETCIEGNCNGKGRIRIGFFLVILAGLLMKKEVRKIIRFILD